MEISQYKFLLSFILPLLVSSGLFYFVLYKCKNVALLRFYINKYKDSKRWGGIVMGIAILVSIVFFQNIFTGFLLWKDFWSLGLGVVILLVGGAWDDLKNISWEKPT